MRYFPDVFLFICKEHTKLNTDGNKLTYLVETAAYFVCDLIISFRVVLLVLLWLCFVLFYCFQPVFSCCPLSDTKK